MGFLGLLDYAIFTSTMVCWMYIFTCVTNDSSGFAAAQVFSSKVEICTSSSTSACQTRLLAQVFVPDGGSDWEVVATVQQGQILSSSSSSSNGGSGSLPFAPRQDLRIRVGKRDSKIRYVLNNLETVRNAYEKVGHSSIGGCQSTIVKCCTTSSPHIYEMVRLGLNDTVIYDCYRVEGGENHFTIDVNISSEQILPAPGYQTLTLSQAVWSANSHYLNASLTSQFQFSSVIRDFSGFKFCIPRRFPHTGTEATIREWREWNDAFTEPFFVPSYYFGSGANFIGITESNFLNGFICGRPIGSTVKVQDQDSPYDQFDRFRDNVVSNIISGGVDGTGARCEYKYPDDGGTSSSSSSSYLDTTCNKYGSATVVLRINADSLKLIKLFAVPRIAAVTASPVVSKDSFSRWKTVSCGNGGGSGGATSGAAADPTSWTQVYLEATSEHGEHHQYPYPLNDVQDRFHVTVDIRNDNEVGGGSLLVVVKDCSVRHHNMDEDGEASCCPLETSTNEDGVTAWGEAVPGTGCISSSTPASSSSGSSSRPLIFSSTGSDTFSTTIVLRPYGLHRVHFSFPLSELLEKTTENTGTGNTGEGEEEGADFVPFEELCQDSPGKEQQHNCTFYVINRSTVFPTSKPSRAFFTSTASDRRRMMMMVGQCTLVVSQHGHEMLKQNVYFKGVRRFPFSRTPSLIISSLSPGTDIVSSGGSSSHSGACAASSSSSSPEGQSQLDLQWDAKAGQCVGIGHAGCTVKYNGERNFFNPSKGRCEAPAVCSMGYVLNSLTNQCLDPAGGDTGDGGRGGGGSSGASSGSGTQPTGSVPPIPLHLPGWMRPISMGSGGGGRPIGGVLFPTSSVASSSSVSSGIYRHPGNRTTCDDQKGIGRWNDTTQLCDCPVHLGYVMAYDHHRGFDPLRQEEEPLTSFCVKVLAKKDDESASDAPLSQRIWRAMQILMNPQTTIGIVVILFLLSVVLCCGCCCCWCCRVCRRRRRQRRRRSKRRKRGLRQPEEEEITTTTTCECSDSSAQQHTTQQQQRQQATHRTVTTGAGHTTTGGTLLNREPPVTPPPPMKRYYSDDEEGCNVGDQQEDDAHDEEEDLEDVCEEEAEWEENREEAASSVDVGAQLLQNHYYYGTQQQQQQRHVHHTLSSVPQNVDEDDDSRSHYYYHSHHYPREEEGGDEEGCDDEEEEEEEHICTEPIIMLYGDEEDTDNGMEDETDDHPSYHQPPPPLSPSSPGQWTQQQQQQQNFDDERREEDERSVVEVVATKPHHLSTDHRHRRRQEEQHQQGAAAHSTTGTTRRGGGGEKVTTTMSGNDAGSECPTRITRRLRESEEEMGLASSATYLRPIHHRHNFPHSPTALEALQRRQHVEERRRRASLVVRTCGASPLLPNHSHIQQCPQSEKQTLVERAQMNRKRRSSNNSHRHRIEEGSQQQQQEQHVARSPTASSCQRQQRTFYGDGVGEGHYNHHERRPSSSSSSSQQQQQQQGLEVWKPQHHHHHQPQSSQEQRQQQLQPPGDYNQRSVENWMGGAPPQMQQQRVVDKDDGIAEEEEEEDEFQDGDSWPPQQQQQQSHRTAVVLVDPFRSSSPRSEEEDEEHDMSTATTTNSSSIMTIPE